MTKRIFHHKLHRTLWEPKMCRLALQLLGMLGNVLGRPRHALQRPRHALQRPRHACNVLGRPRHAFARSEESHIEEKPPHLLPYKMWSQRSSVPPSFHIWNLVVHYSLDFTAYKAASGRISLQCGTLRTLLKHAEDGRGRCKACRGRLRTLPSMPRSCKASLHILGSHNV